MTPRIGPRQSDLANVETGQKGSLIASFPTEARLYAAVITQAKLDAQKNGQLGAMAKGWLAGADQGGLTLRECLEAIAAFRPSERKGARIGLPNFGKETVKHSSVVY